MFNEVSKLRFEKLLQQSVDLTYPQEFNDLDWKSQLSQKTERLKEHLSAFSNYQGGGFLAFGIDDNAKVIGISEDETKKVIQQLGNIARDGLEPAIAIEFYPTTFRGEKILGVYIPESIEKPVRRRGYSLDESYIRANGTTRKMSVQELRTALIGSRSLRFEELPAAVSPEVTNNPDDYFDFTEIFRRLKRPEQGIRANLEFLHANKFFTKSGDRYLPTNLCVLCASRDLSQLPGYERYAVRVTRFVGKGRLATKSDQFFNQGFTIGLDKIIEYIIQQLPYSEVIKLATRLETPLIPTIALREIIANAIIHRDYSRASSYITIDLFDDRIEITNPGTLLPNIVVDRLIDHPSETRNEVLADIMRKLKFCEEEGTGIDKAVAAMEIHGSPPIRFSPTKDFFGVTLFAPKEFKDMEKEERVEAVYQHASLNYVAGNKTNNTSIRQRFHFKDEQLTKGTRLLADAVDAGRIKLANPKASPRDMYYVPYWVN